VRKKVVFESWLSEQNWSEREKKEFKVFSQFHGWTNFKEIEKSCYWFREENKLSQRNLFSLE
jgi:hypothetical protein